jgi:hypothetical protein
VSVLLTTPFRTIPALPLATWEAEFVARRSPLSKAEVADCHAACQGWAVLLDQAIGETSLNDADAIAKKNLLRTTEADGATFKTYSAYWHPFAHKVKDLFDPRYKDGVYYPVGVAGPPTGYYLSIAGFKVVYQGGPGCLSSRGQTCANGERYDPNRSMLGASVATDPNAPSINRSIAASMLRYDRWFGTTPPPTPPPPPSPWSFRQGIIPRTNRNRPGRAMNPTWITIHETGNSTVGANAEMHRRFLQQGGGQESVSFHLVVDDKEAVQLLPFTEIGYHAGDGCDDFVNDHGCFRSIAIETCVNADGNWEQTLRNLVKTAAKLIRDDPELSVERIAQHNRWSQKNCPARIRAQGRWQSLITQIDLAVRGQQ